MDRYVCISAILQAHSGYPYVCLEAEEYVLRMLLRR